MKISVISLCLITAPYFIWFASHGQNIAQKENIPSTFKGKILAASDADMIGGAYANGELNKVAGIEDSLALIEVINGKPQVVSSIHGSNSVISWPAILDYNLESSLAYLAETRAVYKGEEQKMKNVFQDFPEGRKITVIDYGDHRKPKVVQEKNIGENIQGVSLNKNGTLLTAGSTEKGKELIVSTLTQGKINQSFYFTHPAIKPADDGNSGIRTVEFHPSENIIAANLNNTHLIFFKISEDDNKVIAEPIGEPVEVAKKWSAGNWHPNGKYFILTDVAWGNGTLGFLFHGKGKLVSVKMDSQGGHEIVSKVKVGLSPEGTDISPDGRYAVTVNMRRTWAPPKGFWFVPAKKYSSLSLIKIDPSTGELTKLEGGYGFEGALPEDAIFDSESNSLAVTIYHYREELNPEYGQIDFWELKNDQLINTGTSISVTRGVHNLLLVNP